MIYNWEEIESQVKLKGAIDVSDKTIVLFGAEMTGRLILECLLEKGIEVNCFADNDISKQSVLINGKKVIAPSDICSLDNPLVIITNKYLNDVSKQLSELKIEFVTSGLFFLINEFHYYKDIYFNYLEDMQSKKVFTTILSCILQSDHQGCSEIYEENQYFSFPPFSNTTHCSFLDAGAFVGDTIEHVVWRSCGEFSKIYAFEPGFRQFNALKQRVRRLNEEWAFENNKIECIQAGISDKNGKLIFKQHGESLASAILVKKSDNPSEDNIVDVYSIDSFIKDKKIDFIKCDIEGGELKLLKGAEEVIKRNKPLLAICIYHKPMDYCEIPIYIRQLVPEYKMAIRHHSLLYNAETVLYCWI